MWVVAKVPFASLLCLDIHTAAKMIINSVESCVLTNRLATGHTWSLNWNRITLNFIKYTFLFLSYTCRISRANQPHVARGHHIGWLRAYFYITKRSTKFSCVLDHITLLLYFFKWLPISYRWKKILHTVSKVFHDVFPEALPLLSLELQPHHPLLRSSSTLFLTQTFRICFLFWCEDFCNILCISALFFFSSWIYDCKLWKNLFTFIVFLYL